MAIRYYILKTLHKVADRIANKSKSAAIKLTPPQKSTNLISSHEQEYEQEMTIIKDDNGNIQAGLISYDIEQSSFLIKALEEEELHGANITGTYSISSQVGDAVFGMMPSSLAMLNSGRLMQIIGPPEVIKGLADGTMSMVKAKSGGFLGAIQKSGSSKFIHQARFAPVGSVVAPLMIYQVVHVIVGTKQLNDINRRLANIERVLDRIVERQNAKDIGEVIAATSILRDIFQEHQHTGTFNSQMCARLSLCERDLKAHLERLKLLKAQFHGKVQAARQKASSRDRSIELATLIKEQGPQFGQDIRLLVVLCNAVIQLEQGLMAIALEHHPESVSYRKKQLDSRIKECQEVFKDLVNIREIQDEIQCCLNDMNWWQKNLLDRNRYKVLGEASQLEIDAPVKEKDTPSLQSGGLILWKGKDNTIRVKALPSSLEKQTDLISDAPTHQAKTDHKLKVGEIYDLFIQDINKSVPVRIVKQVGNDSYLGTRNDIQELEFVDITSKLIISNS